MILAGLMCALSRGCVVSGVEEPEGPGELPRDSWLATFRRGGLTRAELLRSAISRLCRGEAPSARALVWCEADVGVV
jgi:hypothetical protein